MEHVLVVVVEVDRSRHEREGNYLSRHAQEPVRRIRDAELISRCFLSLSSSPTSPRERSTISPDRRSHRASGRRPSLVEDERVLDPREVEEGVEGCRGPLRSGASSS